MKTGDFTEVSGWLKEGGWITGRRWWIMKIEI